MRVIGNDICYPAKECQYSIKTSIMLNTISFMLTNNIFYFTWILSSDLTVHKLFTSRADLHRTVYTHAKVKVFNSLYGILHFLLSQYYCYLNKTYLGSRAYAYWCAGQGKWLYSNFRCYYGSISVLEGFSSFLLNLTIIMSYKFIFLNLESCML